MIVSDLEAHRGRPFRSRIQVELANLQLIEHLLDSSDASPRVLDLRQWIVKTRSLLIALDTNLSAGNVD
jgi:hypothetical protein